MTSVAPPLYKCNRCNIQRLWKNQISRGHTTYMWDDYKTCNAEIVHMVCFSIALSARYTISYKAILIGAWTSSLSQDLYHWPFPGFRSYQGISKRMYMYNQNVLDISLNLLSTDCKMRKQIRDSIKDGAKRFELFYLMRCLTNSPSSQYIYCHYLGWQRPTKTAPFICWVFERTNLNDTTL